MAEAKKGSIHHDCFPDRIGTKFNLPKNVAWVSSGFFPEHKDMGMYQYTKQWQKYRRKTNYGLYRGFFNQQNDQLYYYLIILPTVHELF